MSGLPCIPEVRREIESAVHHLRRARVILTREGHGELAEMLDRSIAHVGTWTQPGGICDHCEREPIKVRSAAE